MGRKPVQFGQRWFAEQLGCSRQTFVKYQVEPGYPLSHTSGPFDAKDVKSVKKWMTHRRLTSNSTSGMQAAIDSAKKSNPDLGGDALQAAIDANPKAKAQLELLIEKVATAKLNREMKMGEWMLKRVVRRQRVERITIVKEKMMQVALRAGIIANRSEGECEKMLTKWMKEICDAFSREAPGDDDDDDVIKDEDSAGEDENIAKDEEEDEEEDDEGEGEDDEG